MDERKSPFVTHRSPLSFISHKMALTYLGDNSFSQTRDLKCTPSPLRVNFLLIASAKVL
jgi:hypothetical protein